MRNQMVAPVCTLVPLIIMFAFPARSVAQGPITAAELLNRMEQSQNAPLPSLVVKSETVGDHTLENSKRPGFKSLTIEEFRTDNQQNELRTWWRRFGADGSLDDGHGAVQYGLKNPARYISYYQSPGKDGIRPKFSEQPGMLDYAATHCESLQIGKCLFGDKEPVVEILKAYTGLTVADKLEEIDGHPCYVLDGSGSHGQYKLWIDPANGYNWRRATVHKSGSDIMHGQPMNANPDAPDDPKMAFPMTMSEDLLVEVSNVDISNTEGHFFVKQAQIIITDRHKGDEIVHIREDFVLKEVLYNPDFAAIDAFNPNIPSGTLIRSMDFPRQQFNWEDGNIVPLAGTTEVRDIGRVIDASEPAPKQDEVQEQQAQPSPQQTGNAAHRSWLIMVVTAAIIIAIAGITAVNLGKRKSRRP